MSIGISKEIESIIIGLNNKIDIDLSNTDLLDNGKINDKYTKPNIPIGYLYIQLPNQESPDILFGGNWENISSECTGKFLRIEGGNASSFGSIQKGGLPNITGKTQPVRYGAAHETITSAGSFFPEEIDTIWEVSSVQKNSKARLENFNASRSSSIYQDGITEVRPENITVRIWKKIND